MLMPWIFALLACGGELLVSPPSLDFGTVDVQGELPDTGYGALQLTINNATGKPQDLSLHGFDTERFVLGALTVSDSPPTLDTLDDGNQLVITVGVRSYETGERDTEVIGSFDIDGADLSEAITVDWTYTPTRNLGDEEP